MLSIKPSVMKYPLSCTAPVHSFKTLLYRTVSKDLTLICYTIELVGSEDIHPIRVFVEWISFNQRYTGKCVATGSLGVGEMHCVTAFVNFKLPT